MNRELEKKHRKLKGHWEKALGESGRKTQQGRGIDPVTWENRVQLTSYPHTWCRGALEIASKQYPLLQRAKFC